jgi:hypothetical protein
VAQVKSDRFAAPKEITPGPGQYDLEKAQMVKPKPVRLPRQSSFKGASRASSSSSVYTDVDDSVSFKTPSKKALVSVLCNSTSTEVFSDKFESRISGQIYLTQFDKILLF